MDYWPVLLNFSKLFSQAIIRSNYQSNITLEFCVFEEILVQFRKNTQNPCFKAIQYEDLKFLKMNQMANNYHD
ncbi:hypothetical protein BpHYR1_054161 [Brachionus plicatilis]|uniref:Uncharacterized protein n=1 Tax=Brachionus plicatilis TaxID=10195 RepID=A0A3M7PSQ0_BRAPC|nr:hypothetical protein BpHYR1_054161 [Brachionus plicatilis]